MVLKPRHIPASPTTRSTRQPKSNSNKSKAYSYSSEPSVGDYRDVYAERLKRLVKIGGRTSNKELLTVCYDILDKCSNQQQHPRDPRQTLLKFATNLFSSCSQNHYRSPLYYACLTGHEDLVDFLSSILFLSLCCRKENNYNKYVAMTTTTTSKNEEEYSIHKGATLKAHVEKLGHWHGGINSMAFDCCHICALSLEVRHILTIKLWTYTSAVDVFKNFFNNNNTNVRTSHEQKKKAAFYDCVTTANTGLLFNNRGKKKPSLNVKKSKPTLVDDYLGGYGTHTMDFEDHNDEYDHEQDETDGYEYVDENDGYETYDPRLWEEQGELNNNNDSESYDATSDNGSFSTFQSMGESFCASNFTETFDVVSQASSSATTGGGWEFIEEENDIDIDIDDAMSLDSSDVNPASLGSLTNSKKSWANVAASAAAKAAPSSTPVISSLRVASKVVVSWHGNCRAAAIEVFSFDDERDFAKSQYGGKSLLAQLKGNQKVGCQKGRWFYRDNVYRNRESPSNSRKDIRSECGKMAKNDFHSCGVTI